MSSEKTEKPTPRRLQKARESGDVPAVSSLPFSVALIGVLAVFTLKPSVLPGRFGNAISSAVSLNDADVIRHCTSVINEFFFELLIIPLTLLVFSSCARLLSSGPVFSTGILTGIWERINPGNYFQRIFSKEVFLTIIITSIAGIVFSTAGMWFLINPGIEMFNVRAFDSKTFVIILQLLIGAAWKCAACALVYGFLDSLFKRTTWEKRLMMTRRELIEEYRETEGDPLVKSRRKMLHRQLA
ncbi:MAG: EscU/YscU/HrcU family type III secretion system export apparatus switch protein, partial [Candidatus Omnitrophota bacterium]